MPKYLCMQRSVPGGGGGEKPSPAEMQAMYATFNEWREQFAANLLDPGAPLGGGAVITTEGTSDGPFAESKEVVGGYMILEADSLEQAIEIARACPGVVSPRSSLEVREIRTP